MGWVLFLIGLLAGGILVPIVWMVVCIIWPEDKSWDAEH